MIFRNRKVSKFSKVLKINNFRKNVGSEVEKIENFQIFKKVTKTSKNVTHMERAPKITSRGQISAHRNAFRGHSGKFRFFQGGVQVQVMTWISPPWYIYMDPDGVV